MILALYVLFVSCVNPVFLSASNLINIFRATGFTLIVVVGMTDVLITAGLDLLVGSAFALGAIICGMCASAGWPLPLAIAMGILTGVVFGFVIGGIIVKTGIPPLIVTLGMQYVGRGLVSVLIKDVPIYPLPKAFVTIEQTKVFGIIPIIVPISILLAIAGHIVLSKTVFGRSAYAIGGNQEAAKIPGINIRVYVITATLAAIFGILMASRLGSAEPSTGSGFELKVICGAIIGGISTFGGMGTILGASMGALFMGIVTNSLALMEISAYWQNPVFGIILMAFVLTEKETVRLMAILRSLQQQGIACIYISHKLDEVFKLCDRMILLRDKRWISEYQKPDGYDPTKVIEGMIRRRLDVLYPIIDKQIGGELLRVEPFRVPHPFAYGKSIIQDVSLTLRKGEILGHDISTFSRHRKKCCTN
ncbi:MAG: hypothetical protein VB099_11900 [Candidatus Limiplasma sp.]|nr:hypothetical protein [Candidatus Limiplasma sp.]